MSRPRDRSRSAVPRSRGSPGSGDDLSPAWWPAWEWPAVKVRTAATDVPEMQGRYRDSTSAARRRAHPSVHARPRPQPAGLPGRRVERDLYWVTDAVYQSAFLDDDEGVSGGFMTTTSRTAAQRARGAARHPPGDRAGGDRGRAADGGARRHHRQHRPAAHPERAALLHHRPVLVSRVRDWL